MIHNIPTRAARDRALAELVRVLKPGGRIAIFDLLHTKRYTKVLQQSGLEVRWIGTHFLWGFRCRSLIARKPPATP